MDHTAFRVVPMHVARNPVARAINAARLRDAVNEFRATRIALLLDGDDAGGDVHTGVHLLTVCLMAMAIAGFGEHDGVPQMQAGQRALIACAGRGNKWLQADAPVVDEALLCALDLYPQLDARVVAKAWKKLHEMQLAGARA